MHDATYQTIYFSYFLFALLASGSAYFFIRSMKDGYWGPDGEEPKYRMMRDDGSLSATDNSGSTPRRAA